MCFFLRASAKVRSFESRKLEKNYLCSKKCSWKSLARYFSLRCQKVPEGVTGCLCITVGCRKNSHFIQQRPSSVENSVPGTHWHSLARISKISVPAISSRHLWEGHFFVFNFPYHNSLTLALWHSTYLRGLRKFLKLFLYIKLTCFFLACQCQGKGFWQHNGRQKTLEAAKNAVDDRWHAIFLFRVSACQRVPEDNSAERWTTIQGQSARVVSQ